MPDRSTAQTHPEAADERSSDPVFATWQVIQARVMRDLPGRRAEPDARDWSQLLDDDEMNHAPVNPAP